MKKTVVLVQILCLAGIILLLPSCREEQILDANALMESDPDVMLPLDEELRDFLECHHFDTDEAMENAEVVQIEEDIVISKTDLHHAQSNSYLWEEASTVSELQYLQNIYDNESSQIQNRQHVVNKSTLINMIQAGNIKYYIDQSVSNINPGGTEWYNAILTAVYDWAQVSYCRISFTQVSSNSQANLSFYAKGSCPFSCMNEYSGSMMAKACFPNSNNVGRYITMKNVTITSDQKKALMRHELGHALGLRHNNSAGNEPISATGSCGYTGLNLLTGTPVDDLASIMRSTISSQYMNLSSNDKKAIRFMYPENYTIPVISSHSIFTVNSQKFVKLNINSSSVTPYEVVVTRHSTTSSAILQANSFFDPNNANGFYSVPSPNGTWRFRVWRRNYGDYYEISSYRTVAVQ